MDENKNNTNPLEIPDNKPESKENPITGAEDNTQSSKRSNNNQINETEANRQKKMKAIKIAYGLALIIALGGAFAAKMATENAVGELKAPIKDEYITISPTIEETEEPDYEVRQNLENVPDTREETTLPKTEATTQKETSPYAIPFKDKFLSPTGGKIINKFENSKPVYNEALGEWRTHPGADYKASEGGEVTAIAFGTVHNIYDDALYGTIIEIDHGNGLFARYCGFNKETIEVKKGDTVKSSQSLGFLDTVPGESKSDPHLHLELIYEEKLINPEEIIK